MYEQMPGVKTSSLYVSSLLCSNLLENSLKHEAFTWTMVRPCKMASSDSKLPGLSQQRTSLRFAQASNLRTNQRISNMHLPCIRQDQ